MDAGAWDQRYAEAELVWSAEPNRFVRAELEDLPPGRALDVACGEGRNALWLAQRGWQVTAIDFSAVAVGKGRQLAERAGVTVEWQVADVLTYEPEGRFDAIVVAYLHLLPEKIAAVWAWSRLALTPGGILLAVGHDLTNITEGVGGPQYPERLWTAESIVEQLPDLEIERAERVRRPVDTAEGTRDAIDTLVRARRAPA